jgi:PqqD family protein of HPr-rel-A system
VNIVQETAWGVQERCQLLWERFDSGCLIFNPLSGTTHLLFDPVLDIILLLQQTPMTDQQVIQGLDLGLESGEQNREVLDKIGKILRDLDRLGIIRPIPVQHSSAESNPIP